MSYVHRPRIGSLDLDVTTSVEVGKAGRSGKKAVKVKEMTMSSTESKQRERGKRISEGHETHLCQFLHDFFISSTSIHLLRGIRSLRYRLLMDQGMKKRKLD